MPACRCWTCRHWLQSSPAGFLCGKTSPPSWVIRDCADYEREPGSDDDKEDGDG